MLLKLLYRVLIGAAEPEPVAAPLGPGVVSRFSMVPVLDAPADAPDAPGLVPVILLLLLLVEVAEAAEVPLEVVGPLLWLLVLSFLRPDKISLELEKNKKNKIIVMIASKIS